MNISSSRTFLPVLIKRLPFTSVTYTFYLSQTDVQYVCILRHDEVTKLLLNANFLFFSFLCVQIPEDQQQFGGNAQTVRCSAGAFKDPPIPVLPHPDAAFEVVCTTWTRLSDAMRWAD